MPQTRQTFLNCPDWVMARPIAHRGLHDINDGRVENSLAAARAAVESRYAIECDVILSRDGEAMIFHDDDLPRLTGMQGLVKDHTAQQLQQIALLGGNGETIPTLAQLLETIGGKVPLICEIKSNFDRQAALTHRSIAVVKGYSGPVAFKSFDPMVVEWLRELAPDHPRGIVGQSSYRGADRIGLTADQIAELVKLTHWSRTEPDFMSWRYKDLGQPAPYVSRTDVGVPVMSWTITNRRQQLLALQDANQIVFEGFLP
ncbi:MAG: glycerophosphodiester phosphodiesterase family protein [Candidatus Pacebacteria bacterium]|nr:glycerophosphodiester phosphodiesterase family protein [Candidatus Paceibacterota bacterium]